MAEKNFYDHHIEIKLMATRDFTMMALYTKENICKNEYINFHGIKSRLSLWNITICSSFS